MTWLSAVAAFGGGLGGWGSASVAAAEPPNEIGVCAYRAVLFGAADYADDRVGDLDTPNQDIASIGAVLEERYGFLVEVVPDATRAQIIDHLDRLQTEVAECDAVVVYYAGHGQLDEGMGVGFWLPTDARLDSRANWISNDDIRTRLKGLPARHALLVADSCFSGSLTRALESLPQPVADRDVLRAREMASSRSREVLTSGGEELVADQYRNTGMSVFAYFLHQQLSEADARFVTIDQWFADLRLQIMDNAEQRPHSGQLRGAGHELGKLVLVNQAWSGSTAEASPAPRSQAAAVLATPPIPAAPPPRPVWTSPSGVELALLPGGRFSMGSSVAEPGRERDEGPLRSVSVDPLWVMRSEVTQGLWAEVMGVNPSRQPACGATCPVDGISWFDAVEFANALSKRDGLKPAYKVKDDAVEWKTSRSGYRLLTEAEWEYAARAGQPLVYAGADDAARVAWTQATAGGAPHPVCGLKQNAFGLCDMSGNVWEWTWDWYASKAYADDALPTDNPVGPEDGTYRVLRGGAFDRPGSEARVARRLWADPDVARPATGLRLGLPQGSATAK